MSTKADGSDNTGKKQLGEGDSLKCLKSSIKTSDIEIIRQNLVKRSLDVKFDLEGSDYKPIENIGIGAYGVVCSAVHTKSADKVAIKKIPSVFDALSVAKRTYREIKILKHFKHDNIISIREILMPKQNVKNFKDIYVVFDLMESDLHRIIYSKQELSEEHIRYFLYQILRGLKYIHSANVIHRDLKPSNILVNEDCHLRIGDFGMARGVFYTPDEPSYYMTQYVATRWYRAPEILLSMLEYGAALDMWSVGCIFAEMMGRKHLFPGKDYISQVKLIVGVLGTPSDSVLKNCHHEILKKMIKGFEKREPISWEKLFPKASKKSLDLVSKMLVINPSERISVDQALSHRLLNNYHDPSDEPVCVPTFNFDFEKVDMDKTHLRSAIMEEIISFHQPKHPTLSFSAFLRPAPMSDESSLEEAKIDKLPESKLQPTADMGCSQQESGKEVANTSSSTGKPSSKLSPVSIDMGKLQLIASNDIEMLSAQSNDGRTMEVRHTDMLTINNDVKQGEKSILNDSIASEIDVSISADKKGGNTISEDTKALVKQALINATQRRQRAESQGDESKDSKPITAAQRQREREERRRKKKERALEKVKKSKEKKRIQEPPAIALSNQDMELLRRWTVMQNPGQNDHASQSPPHPGLVNNTTSHRSSTSDGTRSIEVSLNSQPNTCSSHFSSSGSKPRQLRAKPVAPASVTMGSSITTSQNSCAQAVLFPSNQRNLLSQANFIPVIAVPSTVKPCQLEIKRIFQPSGLQGQVPLKTVPPSQQTSDNTKTLLQTAVLMRNQNNSNKTDMLSLSTKNVAQRRSSNLVHTETDSQDLSTHNSNSSSHTGTVNHDNLTARISTIDHDFITASTTTVNHDDLAARASTINLDYLTASTTTVNHDQITNSSESDPNLLKSEPVVITKDDKLSPRSQGNDLLDFLTQHLKDSPREKTVPQEGNNISPHSYYLDQKPYIQEQSLFMVAEPASRDNHHNNLSSYHNYSSKSYNSEEQLARSNSTPSLLRQDSQSQSSQELRQRTSVPVIASSVLRRPCGGQLFSSFPTQGDFTASLQTSETNKTFPEPNTGTHFHSHIQSLNNYQEYDTHISPVNMLFQSPSEFSLQMQHPQLCHQVFENAGTYDEFNSISSSTTSRSPTTIHYHQNFSGFSQPQPQSFSTNQDFLLARHTGTTDCHTHIVAQPNLHDRIHSAAAVSSSGSFNSSLLQQAGNTMTGQSSQYTLHPGHKLTVNCNSLPREPDSNNELIALLTKQLSKQHVIDIVPSLALTPRGTGAGYGVGMDLDAMLTDAQEQLSVRAEASPLSSSLLADWLDISENISQADLEALERELVLQSPMQC